MKTEKDTDYICKLLSQGKAIVFCDSPIDADAIVYDSELLTNAEREALEVLADYGSIKEAASKIHKAEATIKKQLCSARKKLKVKTNIQAIVIAYRLGLINPKLPSSINH